MRQKPLKNIKLKISNKDKYVPERSARLNFDPRPLPPPYQRRTGSWCPKYDLSNFVAISDHFWTTIFFGPQYQRGAMVSKKWFDQFEFELFDHHQDFRNIVDDGPGVLCDRLMDRIDATYICQGCRRFLTISDPRWDQPIRDIFI